MLPQIPLCNGASGAEIVQPDSNPSSATEAEWSSQSRHRPFESRVCVLQQLIGLRPVLHGDGDARIEFGGRPVDNTEDPGWIL